jgi:hypothetical protein
MSLFIFLGREMTSMGINQYEKIVKIYCQPPEVACKGEGGLVTEADHFYTILSCLWHRTKCIPTTLVTTTDNWPTPKTDHERLLANTEN